MLVCVLCSSWQYLFWVPVYNNQYEVYTKIYRESLWRGLNPVYIQSQPSLSSFVDANIALLFTINQIRRVTMLL